ncbi:hypothetical protein Taro_015138 [Colocasia esculenta]|uniref:Uncharacterized protein n=1 Tax=Colocasia esculenta TaxID=4460 RepID=A0A843ULH7_COLES|nr:hypothetical protein [Colocasia esculenta]
MDGYDVRGTDVYDVRGTDGYDVRGTDGCAVFNLNSSSPVSILIRQLSALFEQSLNLRQSFFSPHFSLMRICPWAETPFEQSFH